MRSSCCSVLTEISIAGPPTRADIIVQVVARCIKRVS